VLRWLSHGQAPRSSHSARTGSPPRIGDKVTVPPSDFVREITYVSKDGDEVNLQAPGTNLEWYRVEVSKLKFVERQPAPRSSNPFTAAEPTFDAEAILIRLYNAQLEVLERLDSDMTVLKAYLKTQHAPPGAIETLETLTVEQHVSWKKAIEGIKKLLDG
jgi:hypothetical protein